MAYENFEVQPDLPFEKSTRIIRPEDELNEVQKLGPTFVVIIITHNNLKVFQINVSVWFAEDYTMNVNRALCTIFKNLTFSKSITGVESSVTNIVNDVNRRLIHFSLPYCASHFKHRDRKDLLRTVPKTDEGLEDQYISLNASIIT